MVMKLEDEISQKKFKSEYHKLVVNLIYSHNWLTNHNKKFFSDFDLTVQQYNILRILRGQFPNVSTVNLLKERMLDKMSDASRLVERLKQKELVERVENKQDRRQVDILITQKGLDLLAEMDKNETQINDLLSNLNTDEAKLLNDLLDKMRG